LPAARIGLVSPYTADVQDRIMAVWGSQGLNCVAERHLSLADNFSFAEVAEAEVARLIEEVVGEGADAVVVLCTNMRGAGVAEPLERKLGAGVYDSIAVTLWGCLIAAGVDPSVVRGWGSVFANPDLLPATFAPVWRDEPVVTRRG
jgi:maleate isomerase